jgi:DNA-binding CsgD family transcriptional regulator
MNQPFAREMGPRMGGSRPRGASTIEPAPEPGERGEKVLCSSCRTAMPRPFGGRVGGGRTSLVPVEPAPLPGGSRRDAAAEVEAVSGIDRLRRRFGLTLMEAVVARALVDGLSYRETAAEFEISTETVHSHVKAIYRKANVTSARQFVALFLSRC